MSRWVDSLSQALSALNDHRLRTSLSILGIMIGIAAVIAVSTISKGGNHIVFSELQTFGLNSVWVYRDRHDDSPLRRSRPGTGIDNADFEAVKEQADALGIRRVTPVVRPWTRNWLVKNNNQLANAEILGAGADHTAIVNDVVIAGRAINRNDVARKHAVALLAPGVVAKLFPAKTNAVGQYFRIHGKRFVVVGLLQGKSRDFLASIGSSGGQNANDRIVIPFTVLQQMQGGDSIENFQLEVEEFNQAQQVGDRVRRLLGNRHPNGFQYRVETMASYIETTNRILGGVAIVGIIAASISLLVGGMGIMNMMGTAVLERTREIGVRKAIGAKESDILLQFLLEAALISVAGGILGLLIGGLASVVLAWVTGFPLLPSPFSVAGALLVSIVVGMLSGYLPAKRAARMHPVEALRTE